jgi:putative iron-dependent peroxidase
MATPQPGVFAQGTRSHRYLEFDLDAGAGAGDVLAALAPLRQPSVTAGGANIVVAFGPRLWRRLNPTTCPDSLTAIEVDGVPSTPHDAWVWIHGTGDDVLLDVARRVARLLAPVTTLAGEIHGFVYHDSRDLTGFVDGTENPAVEEAFEVAVVPDGSPGAGGSFVLTQRWVHDLDRFHALDVADQERVIGRTKPDSAELDDDAKPRDAHIARVVITEDGEELEIYRRSVPYGSVTEHGLYFVAFSADPTRYEKMLRRMFGSSGDELHDHLTEFTRPVSSALYFAPSLQDLGDALG